MLLISGRMPKIMLGCSSGLDSIDTGLRGVSGTGSAHHLRHTNFSKSCSSLLSRSPKCNGHGFSSSAFPGLLESPRPPISASDAVLACILRLLPRFMLELVRGLVSGPLRRSHIHKRPGALSRAASCYLLLWSLCPWLLIFWAWSGCVVSVE